MDRIEQVMLLQNSLQAAGEPLLQELRRRRAERVQALISADSPEVRGAIWELDYLLELPQLLQQEAVELRSKTGEVSQDLTL